VTCRACGSPKHPGMNCKLAALARSQSSSVNVNTAPVSTNTHPVNTNKVDPVNTNRCAHCSVLEQRIAELEQTIASTRQQASDATEYVLATINREQDARIAELEARLGSRSQYMRDYMRKRREKKVPEQGGASRV